MNIHPVKHTPEKNRYCGPSAISILTGMSSGEAARLLRHVSGRVQIQTTSTTQVRRALMACGIGSRAIPVPTTLKTVKRKASLMSAGGTFVMNKGDLTLAAWLKQTTKLRSTGRVFLVVAGHHWQIITGRRYCCGISEKIVSITDKVVKRRARVTEVWEVFPGTTGVVIPKAAKRPKTNTRDDPQRKELEAVLRANDIPKGKLVKWDSTITDYVIPKCDHFTMGCSTIHYNWPETLQRILGAIDHPEIVLENDGHWSE